MLLQNIKKIRSWSLVKIKLLIAIAEVGYADYLSGVLAEKYAEIFEVGICTTAERLEGTLVSGRYDVALLDPDFLPAANLDAVALPLLLIGDKEPAIECGLKVIGKYRRISSIAGGILEYYAEICEHSGGFGAKKARVTAVWSPSGGCGKTAAALAFAANRAANGRQAVYLNLENFACTSAYFQGGGKSISKVFEKLESNVGMYIAAIRQRDDDSGIFYFSEPENYDDMNILTAKDVETLVGACAEGADELVVDLPCQCGQKTQTVFALADTVLLVCDRSAASRVKLSQFLCRHDVFGKIQAKTVLLSNKGSDAAEPKIDKTIYLPLVDSDDPVFVFKALARGNFDF